MLKEYDCGVPQHTNIFSCEIFNSTSKGDLWVETKCLFKCIDKSNLKFKSIMKVTTCSKCINKIKLFNFYRWQSHSCLRYLYYRHYMKVNSKNSIS